MGYERVIRKIQDVTTSHLEEVIEEPHVNGPDVAHGAPNLYFVPVVDSLIVVSMAAQASSSASNGSASPTMTSSAIMAS